MASCRVFSEYDAMPWKNGLGVAVEIAIVPPGQNFRVENFIFRLSRTELTASRHFSLFHSYERISVRLKGDPMKLRHNKAATVNTIEVLQPYSFKGDWYTESLVENPAIDLNLIYHREKATADMRVIVVGKQSASGEKEEVGSSHTCDILISQRGSTFLYCLRGSTDVAAKDQDGRETNYLLHPDETFEAEVMRAPLHISLVNRSTTEDCILVLVDLSVRDEVLKDENENVSTEEVLQAESDSGENHDNSLIFKIWGLHKEVLVRVEQKKSQKEDFMMPKRAEDYKPPTRRNYHAEGEVPPPIVKDSLVISDFPRGELRSAWINMVKNGLGEWIRVPVLVARGVEDGPVLGITAVVHGNELNGVPCIHKVVASLDMAKLKGTVVGVPCVNVDGFLRCHRGFSDGADLNARFPGVANGTASQKFCHAFMEKIVKPNFTYLIDLHTAGFGSINSYYVMADLEDPVSRRLANLLQPQVILHDSGRDGTLGGAATKLGIKGIHVEIGNPQLLQTQFVQWSTHGIMSVLKYFKMISVLVPSGKEPIVPIVCQRGYWMHTRSGGILEVYPDVNTLVRKGDLVARMKDIFGNYVEEYFVEDDGAVIGKSSNPVAEKGSRILHLGIIDKPEQQDEES